MLLWGQRCLAQRYSAPRRKLSLLRSASIRCCRSTIAFMPSPSDHLESDAIVAASTVPAPRDQQASCDRRRDSTSLGEVTPATCGTRYGVSAANAGSLRLDVGRPDHLCP